MVAKNIRKERTGVHALVAIRWNYNQLESDLFNIERNEERRKLANGAWKLLPIEAKAVFPAEKMKAELDLFCEGLWETHIGRVVVEELRPARDRKQLRMLGPYIVDHGGTILFGQPGTTKALALDTPIPTPDGWTTMGELRVGDLVFDDQGAPCRVTGKSEIFKNRPCYKVRSDSGDEIIADEEHLWRANLNRARKETYLIHTTKTLARKRNKRAKIKIAGALQLPERELPIDPYVLGVWLGDGTAREAAVTQSLEDGPWLKDRLATLGYPTSDWNSSDITFGVRNLKAKLKELNLINNKHVPSIYMRSSIDQRLRLLQGLIDTDGCVTSRGCTVFTSKDWQLADSVRELVVSLGIKAFTGTGNAVFRGIRYGTVWRVSFHMKDSASLPRKAERTRNAVRTVDHYVDAVPCQSVDTVCIAVDSPSHLFLAGRSMIPTHNTWIAMLIAQTANSGSPAVWPVTRPHKVLFVNLERDRLYFEERLAQINRALGLDESFPMAVINRRGASLKDVEHAAQKYVEENGIEILVLDSISRAGAGNIIDATVANEVMDTLNRICPTWLAIAHAPKPQKEMGGPPTVIGSTMFGAAADLTMNLTSEVFPDRILTTMTVGKSNIRMSGKPEHFMLDMAGGKLNSVRKVEEADWKVAE